MKVNLHLHSKYSDGTQWPEEIIERASQLKLTHVALTDHDCMEGVPAFLKAAEEVGISALAGVEIDCEAPEIAYNSEVLAYFPGGQWSSTREFCLDRIRHRRQRIENLITGAAEYFDTALSFEELNLIRLGGLPAGLKNPQITYSKPDLFVYLKRKNLIQSTMRYPEYKNFPFLVQEPDPKPHVRTVIDVIRQDGGIPVLPHPALIFNRDVEKMRARGGEIFKWFKSAGIMAVECNYYNDGEEDKTNALNSLTRNFVAELGLKTTWGSDCHGPGHESSNTMDKFWGDQDVPF